MNNDVAIFNATRTANCSIDVTITVGGIDVQARGAKALPQRPQTRDAGGDDLMHGVQ